MDKRSPPHSNNEFYVDFPGFSWMYEADASVGMRPVQDPSTYMPNVGHLPVDAKGIEEKERHLTIEAEDARVHSHGFFKGAPLDAIMLSPSTPGYLNQPGPQNWKPGAPPSYKHLASGYGFGYSHPKFDYSGSEDSPSSSYFSTDNQSSTSSASRSQVPDVHYTPYVQSNLQAAPVIVCPDYNLHGPTLDGSTHPVHQHLNHHHPHSSSLPGHHNSRPLVHNEFPQTYLSAGLIPAQPLSEKELLGSRQKRKAPSSVAKSRSGHPTKSSQVKRCPICQKKLRRDLTRHMRIHEAVADFACPFPREICPHKRGQFNRPYEYKKHLMNCHFTFDDPEAAKNASNLSEKLKLGGRCQCGYKASSVDGWLENHIRNRQCPLLDKCAPSVTNR